ncbi:ligand-gated channel [Bizionia arctica]|uniref:Ligand-gated channel n=2 Tax=Bizionia arctica TaxID=1495645 RepID=A0A917GNG6_9FLAO|nr:ligand-gated channel [Bizionia arctica]
MTVIFLTVILNPLIAQNPSGLVTDISKIPISGVAIFLDDKKITETNEEGEFTLPEVYQLPIIIELKHFNYDVKTVTLVKAFSLIRLVALDNTQDLDEIILSSTYQKESQVIIPTAKISSQKLKEFSPTDLTLAINEIPGVYIQSGAINTNRIVIRGVGSRTLYGTNKIRGYFNGIPITNGIGETAIDAFNPEDIESLEIVKGPKATQYGTNLGGTLLLNSKQAQAGETYFESSLTLGSFGMLKNNVSVATANEKVSLNLNYDHFESDGFRENSNYNRNAVLLTSNYRINDKNDIGFLFNYNAYVAQISSSIGKTAFEEDPSQAAYTWNEAQGYEDNKQLLTGLNYTHRFTDDFSNTTSVFYSYLDHYEPRPFNILDEYTNGYGARTLFAKDFQFLKKVANLSFGGELYRDQYHWKTLGNLYETNNGNGSLEGELLSNNQEKRNNLNVFATITLPFTNKLEAQFGLNFNSTNYQFIDHFNMGEQNRSTDRNFDPIFAPNMNILYRFNPSVEGYVSISRGFNYPSLEETLTPEGLVNPDLGPETGINYEVGTKAFFFKNKLQIQLAGYLLDIENLLVADRVGEDQYVGRNAGKTQHKGIELSLSYTEIFANGFLLSPYVNAEFSDNRFIDFVDGNLDYSGNKLTGVPNNKVNGGLHLGYKNVQFYTNFLYVGEMPLDDANTLTSDEYTVFNTKVSYNNNITKQLSFEINAGINNFTNTAYASSILINAVGFGNTEPRYFYPGMPRNWFAGFKMAYAI